eukprot:CAMPEP_0204440178 /NCGR_PEP_ID=MMETSP0470-20130426/82785_1 /ASSEMBLY_ACC=CAM_ASM_000385 /TAXON_ID=2969 /ORGANISM="Oxyrrhis marina" /LENGTH=292 /DNA_ID=CAMNT_0051439161 /DNA_START=1 /DNA_END=880 /DNA_ORIENTATION=-
MVGAGLLCGWVCVAPSLPAVVAEIVRDPALYLGGGGPGDAGGHYVVLGAEGTEQNRVEEPWLYYGAIMFAVCKRSFSYLLALVASLGWGITRPYLEASVGRRVRLLACFFIVGDVVQQVFVPPRSTCESTWLIVALVFPVALLKSAVFVWTYSALSSLLSELKHRGQTARLQLFQNLGTVLGCAVFVAAASMIHQMLAAEHPFETGTWTIAWISEDGVPHVLFFVVLVAMMWLWKPNDRSEEYAYSIQVDSVPATELGKVTTSEVDVEVGEDDESDNEDENSSFWAQTQNGA